MTETPKLTPASDNPWYVLMTVAGEQIGRGFDYELHVRNRRFWNGWAGAVLSDTEKVRIVEEMLFKLADLRGLDDAERRSWEVEFAPLTDNEHGTIAEALQERCGGAAMPEPHTRVDLSGVQFPRRLSLSNFVFPKGADFTSSVFSGETEFWGAVFSNETNFSETLFASDANFMRANFDDTAAYFRSTFAKNASFSEAIFSKNVNFARGTFTGSFSFRETRIFQDVIFRNATFTKFADFRRAEFHRDADFSDSKFCTATKFRGAKFVASESGPPQFFGAQLHEDTDWTDVEWPGPPRNRDEAIQHRRAYERLKLMMDGQRKFHDEHMFLRMELRCREIEEPHSWASWASRLFRWSSDYGWSIQRPAAGLAGLLLAGWTLIFLAEWVDLWFGGGDYLGLG